MRIMCTVKPVSLAAEKLIPFNLSGCSEAAEINILGMLPVGNGVANAIDLLATVFAVHVTDSEPDLMLAFPK